jgi:hypothetical protein
MSNSKKNFISFQNEKAIVQVSESDARIVTPTDPLVIDYTPASFNDIEIQGGSIYSTTRTQVTIKKLTKTS